MASSANRCSGKCEGKEDEDGYFLGKREPLPLWRGWGDGSDSPAHPKARDSAHRVP